MKKTNFARLSLLLWFVFIIVLIATQIIIHHSRSPPNWSPSVYHYKPSNRYRFPVGNQKKFIKNDKVAKDIAIMDKNLRSMILKPGVVPELLITNRKRLVNEMKQDRIRDVLQKMQTITKLKTLNLPVDILNETTRPGPIGNDAIASRPSTKSIPTDNPGSDRIDLRISYVEDGENNTGDIFNQTCSVKMLHLRNKIPINMDRLKSKKINEFPDTTESKFLNNGGNWRPMGCISRHKVAIVIPFRDRENHLVILLHHLHPILQHQQLDYQIFVVEQSGHDLFNKGSLMNIAFLEALKQRHFDCFIFHDVDLLSEDERNMHSCSNQPRHMSVLIDEMNYKLVYEELVGGVLQIPTPVFFSVNGYSNLYWGWGAEDDDMAYRFNKAGFRINRPPSFITKYRMIKHTKRKPTDARKRYRLLYTVGRRYLVDGVGNVKYRSYTVTKKPLFTHIVVDLGKPPEGFA